MVTRGGASQETNPMMKRITRETLLAWIAALELVSLLVLALWPTPSKYPWGLPLTAAGTFVLAARSSRGGNDFLAFLLGFTALSGLATWTLSSWFELDFTGTLLVWTAVLALPVLWLFVLVRRAPAAE